MRSQEDLWENKIRKIGTRFTTDESKIGCLRKAAAVLVAARLKEFCGDARFDLICADQFYGPCTCATHVLLKLLHFQDAGE